MPKKRYIFNDEKVKNSYGFYVDTAGISLSRFNDNPVCLDDHQVTTKAVLGNWEDVEVNSATLTGVPNFDTKDPDGMEVVRKVEAGKIKGVSMGIFFDPKDLKMVGNQLHLTKCELYEVSFVAVPSNAKAIALYTNDGKQMTEQEVQNLCLSIQDKNYKSDNTMKKVNLHLQLAEDANEEATLKAIQAIETDLKTAATERDTWKLKAERLQKSEDKREEALFTRELSAAQKDGRLDAGGKLEKSILKLKETDKGAALEMLQNLPKHKSIADSLKNDSKTLAAFDKMTWDELDKGNKLAQLKADHPEYYAGRFKEKFGREPRA